MYKLTRPLRHYSKHVAERMIILPSSKTTIEVSEYKQLPDDSQYIEKYYHELGTFAEELKTNSQIEQNCYSDFADKPSELIFELEKYFNMKIVPKYIDKDNGSTVIDRYYHFLINVTTTLRLNGGHSFIFDVLLQSKRLFDQMQDH